MSEADGPTAEQAMARLLDEPAAHLNGYVARRFPSFSSEDVEDVITFAQVKIWRAWERYRAYDDLASLFFRIAINRCKDILKERERLQVEAFPEADLIYAPQVSGGVLSQKWSLALQEILAVLDDEERVILEWDGAGSGADLAKMWGVPASNLRMRRWRLKRRIQGFMRERGFDLPGAEVEPFEGER